MLRFKILFFVLVALFALTAARADEYDTLRLKYRDRITGVGYDTTDTLVENTLASLASTANSFWSKVDKSSTRTYLWSILASPTDSEHLSENFGRLRWMALAYSSQGCSLYGNATLLADIIAGLDWINTNCYNTSTPIAYDNWWSYTLANDWSTTGLSAPTVLSDNVSTQQLKVIVPMGSVVSRRFVHLKVKRL